MDFPFPNLLIILTTYWKAWSVFNRHERGAHGSSSLLTHGLGIEARGRLLSK